MKTKQLIITILMITFVTMITTKVEATENDEQVEQTQNIENIEKDKQYNLTKEVKVKTLPLIFAIEKETIPSGNIRVTDILNDWCKIENEGKSGWIRINTIKTSVKQDNNQEKAKKEENLNTEGNNNQEQTNSSNEEESNQNQQENKTEEVTEISKTGYVKADGLNIRKEPTTSSEAIHSLSFNSKVKITGEIDGWYRIDYNDQIGYVSQKYVSDTKLPETTARGGYDRTTASSEENTVANQEAVEENQVETEEEQEEESTASATSSEGNDVVEFAKKYKLPQVIQNFIIQHHGEGLASYFYNQAVQEEGIENVKEEQFRYTGPKPNRKETAILMLADAVESAVRAMKGATVDQIENIIDKIIVERLNDGQLADSPLTLKDLKVIASTFSRILRGMQHNRIKYQENIAEEFAKNKIEMPNKILDEDFEKKIKELEDKNHTDLNTDNKKDL